MKTILVGFWFVLLIHLLDLSPHLLIQFLYFFSRFLNLKAHLRFLRNGNKVKRSKRVKAIECLKWGVRSSIGMSPIVGKLNLNPSNASLPYPLIR